MHVLQVFTHYNWSCERAHDGKAHERKATQVLPVQLRLCFFWKFAAPHEKAQWRKGFRVQPMWQSFRTEEQSHNTFQNSHDLDQIVKLILFLFEERKKMPTIVLNSLPHHTLCVYSMMMMMMMGMISHH